MKTVLLLFLALCGVVYSASLDNPAPAPTSVPHANQADVVVGSQSNIIAAALTNMPTLQQVVNAGPGATNVGSLADVTDLSGTGRRVFGTGLNVTNIDATAVGASQSGFNNGTQTIGDGAYGASQSGANAGTQTISGSAYGASQSGYNKTGTQTIGDGAYGASQSGRNAGTQTIDANAVGASQSGRNYGTQTIGECAYGAQQRGQITVTATATNNGIGAVQLMDLTNGQQAVTTAGGAGSILLGAGIASNRYAIVAGDGQESHGDGSISAASMWVNGTNVMTLVGGVPTLQQVVNAGPGATNVGSLANVTDLSGSGRRVFGTGLSVANIDATAVGASQSGWNNAGTMTIAGNAWGASQSGWNNAGTMTIGISARGASQRGVNVGTQTIGQNASGASQSGHNASVQTIGESAFGASQLGFNYGSQTIGDYAYGAQQFGWLDQDASAANNGVGAVQLLDLTEGQNALTTSGGKSSLLLGAGTASNRYAIVAGDGQESHGDGSITAGGGFYGDGSGLTGITAAQVGAVSNTPAGIAAAGIYTNGYLLAYQTMAGTNISAADSTYVKMSLTNATYSYSPTYGGITITANDFSCPSNGLVRLSGHGLAANGANRYFWTLYINGSEAFYIGGAEQAGDVIRSALSCQFMSTNPTNKYSIYGFHSGSGVAKSMSVSVQVSVENSR